jgi:hypothetical protein
MNQTLREIIGQPKKSVEEIQTIIDKVKFKDRTFRLIEKADNVLLLQMSYLEENVNNPGSEPVLQSTRKWYISQYMTESEIVEACWACVCRSQLHVAGEHFQYAGRRVYSQHFSIDARIEMCDDDLFDSRIPIKK